MALMLFAYLSQPKISMPLKSDWRKIFKLYLNMKKYLAILFILIGFALQAQDTIPPLSNIKGYAFIKDSIIVLGTFPSNTGQTDSSGYITKTFPSFATDGGYITVEQIKNKWANREFKNISIKGNLEYRPDKKPTYTILRNRKGISMYYTVRIYNWWYREMTKDQKIYWWYELGLKLGIVNETWWNLPRIDTLARWDFYYPPIIDTTSQDTTL